MRQQHHPELATVLFRRTLLATAAVALIAAIGLGALTIVNVRQEVHAARELVEQAVHASRLTAERPGAALLEPDHTMLRGLRLQMVDGGRGSVTPAADAAREIGAATEAPPGLLDRLAERWFGVSDRFSIPLTSDSRGPLLLVQGHAVGELKEQLVDMSIVLLALGLAVVALGLAHGWVVRGVRGPLAEMTRAAVSMSEGELSRRIAAPRVAEFAALARALNHLAGSLEQTRTLQAELTDELVSLRETERKTLARELHDDLGQRLAVLAAETHLLRTQLKSADGGAVRTIATGIQSLQLSVRSILERLREGQPMVLPDLDAAAVLDDWRRREPGVRWRADSLGSGRLQDLGLDEAGRATLARILQESLANAFRHAQPSEVSVQLVRQPGSCELLVRNDGVRPPLDPHALPRVPMAGSLPFEPVRDSDDLLRTPGDGHGILGMIERARMAGGSLRAGTSATSCAWEVLLVLPHACLRPAAVTP